MNLPAEDEPNGMAEEDTETKGEAPSEEQPIIEEADTAPSEASTEPLPEEPALDIGYRYYQRNIFTDFREHIQSMTMLRDDLFLSILAITLLNAVIFLYYTSSTVEGISLKAANQELRSVLGREGDFFAPVTDFISTHGDFSNVENSEFNTSLARFRSRLSRLGVESSDLFFLDEFVQKNGGLYWSKKSDRAPTVYQPVSPNNSIP